MATASNSAPSSSRSLRLWPGIVLVLLQWLVRFALPLAVPDALSFAVLGGLAGGLAVIVWWAFWSRAPRGERFGGAGVMIVILALTPLLLHPSIATGMMGMMFFIYAVPTLSLAFVAWAVCARSLSGGLRWVTMIAAILLACAGWGLVRTEGMTGSADSDFEWRWAPTPEERLLARASEPTGSAPVETAEVAEAEWPGFRGPGRDGDVLGVRIATDWQASPPEELWRRPIGPGWSSFAVQGRLVYTQEQRGEEEVVACYDVATGEPVWLHRDPVRFWESNAGAGPRATPTVAGERVIALGATGLLNVLDARDGRVIWSRDAAADTGMEIPTWGVSGSPLLWDEIVYVAVSGRLAAYDAGSGEPLWMGPENGASYSSPHLATIDDVPQILLVHGQGVSGFEPVDGALLWEHAWEGYPIVQPALAADGDVLISVTSQSGIRRLDVAHGAQGWTAEERWTSIRLKPYFNDFVVHEGHVYGFDGGILAAIDVEDGERRWKGGRYGHGQLVLLPDQDLLLVLSERGEVVLVEASPDGFTERALFPAIEGKTWNHPVLTGDVLLVRNDEEMAAFRLAAVEG